MKSSIRAFPVVKNSAVCGEFPVGSKIHFSHWETYFPQFIDKFLKLEEVEYLIHHVTFLCNSLI